MFKILHEIYIQEDLKLKFNWAFCIFSGNPNIGAIWCVLNLPLILF